MLAADRLVPWAAFVTAIVSPGSLCAQERSDVSAPSPNAMPETVDTATWLAGHKHTYVTAQLADASVYWLGFFPRADLTPEQLKVLDKGVLKPGFVERRPGHAIRKAIEVLDVGSDASGGRCAALLQVVQDKSAHRLSAATQHRIEVLRRRLPDYKLQEGCVDTSSDISTAQLNPPRGPDLKAHIAAAPYVIEVDAGHDCSSFGSTRSGDVRLSGTTALQFRGHIGGIPQSARGSASTTATFQRFEFGFGKRTQELGYIPRQLVKGDFLKSNPDQVELDFYAAEDESTDQFCLMARLTQGTSIIQIARIYPRHSVPLAWSALPTSGGGRNPWPEATELGEAMANAAFVQRPKRTS